VEPTAHDLEDTYLPAFRAAITEGHADSIMCAYNAIDGAPACASDMLLGKYLRGAWKFQGYVVSDCDAVADVARGHHYAADNEHAAAASMEAGTDLDCGNAYNTLGDAVRQGVMPESVLDASLVRLFTARMKLGMFDPPEVVAYAQIPYSDVNSAAHRALALKAAQESIVLLQNRSGFLPLKNPEKILVVGPTAEIIPAIEGNYTPTAPNPVLPLAGIEKQFPQAVVKYAAGSVLAAGVRATVPSNVLHPDATAVVGGLRGEYFDNVDLSGGPMLTRIDRNISFDWSHAPPVAEFGAAPYSVRWSGEIVPPGAGQYVFGFRGVPLQRRGVVNKISSVKIFIDDKLVVDSTTGAQSSEYEFADADEHALRIEYVSYAGNAEHDDVSFDWLPPAQPLLEQAVEAAKQTDVVVAFVGLSPDLEGEEMNVHVDGFDGGDRTDINLPDVQEKLLEAVKATGKPLVVVLTTGSAIALNWADEHADAVMEAWYDGEEAGTAIAQTLAGENNPAGRLPVTFYRDVKDLPAFTDYAMKNRTYRYFNGPVLYPFGYGLSYAKFRYTGLRLSSASIAAGAGVTASVTIQNTSAIAGDEAAELYVQAPGAEAGVHPFLAGFVRVHLEAGERKLVSIPLTARELSRVDETGDRWVKAGKYSINVGGGQPGFSPMEKSVLQVHGEKKLEK
jgi:beta-glucosidase